MTQANSERLRIFVDLVWNQGDIDQADGFIAARYDIRHDPGDPWDGKTLTLDGFKERVRVSRAPFPDQQFSFVDMSDAEDRVMAMWTWHGTHKGDLPGFPASGRSISMTGATIYYFDGDRICGHWQVADRLSVWHQLSMPET